MIGRQVDIEELTDYMKGLAPKRKIDRVIIHHFWKPKAADWKGKATLDAVYDYHARVQGWDDIGYHVVVGPDDSVWLGRPMEQTGAHTIGQNERSVGIAYAADFDSEEPKENGYDTGVRVCAAVLKRFGLDENDVYFHHVDPETPRVIQSLRQSGLLTALLSNSDSEVVSPFGQSPLCDVFDDIVFSHEVGLAKPDPAIFQLSCDRLGLKPSECLFVGDGANREFDGARAVGMKTALVMRYANPERRDEWGRVCDFVIEDLSGLPSR